MLSAYKNGKTKVKIKCTKCNTISQPTPTNLLRPGAGCRHCSIIIPLNIAKKRLSKKKIDILQYISFSEKALLRCEKCQYIWKASPDQIFHTSGCPVCNARKNEKLTLKYLKEMLKNITIEYQYSVKYDIKKRFIIDYAFKTKNKQYYVEYNGVQHYKPVKFFGGEKRFKKQKSRDENLMKYCINNNIILIEIDGRKYTDDKIKTYLKNKLSSYNLI